MNYTLNSDKYFADITDGIAILIDIESGFYYGMNPLTSNIFENIISGANTEELSEKIALVKGYDEAIKAKYDAFISDLLAKEMIVANDDNASVDIHITFEEYKNDRLDFLVSEYREAAELLLADPIHQVKEEKGWGPEKESLR